MVSGPVLLKIKGKLIFKLWGSKKQKKKSKQIDEICKMLVSGALDDTKTIGKAGGDIFANSGLEKHWKNKDKMNSSPEFSQFGSRFSPERPESTYKRLGAIWQNEFSLATRAIER